MRKSTILLVIICLIGGIATAQSSNKGERKKNMIIKEWNTKVGATQPFLDHQTTYDASGRKIEEIEYASYGQKNRSVYEYKGNSRKVYREIVYNDKNKVVKIKVFEYDEEGNKTKQYTYRPNGKLETTKTFEYSYK